MEKVNEMIAIWDPLSETDLDGEGDIVSGWYFRIGQHEGFHPELDSTDYNENPETLREYGVQYAKYCGLDAKEATLEIWREGP